MEADYDDFGNYIGGGAGPDGDADADAGADAGAAPAWLDRGDDAMEEDDAEVEGAGGGGGGGALAAFGGRGAGAASSSTAVVMHEDKKYYPDAAEVYPEAETLVQDEDTQPLSLPIVAPVSARAFSLLEATPPATAYKAEFLAALMASPQLLRNVAVVGHLHHGKTALLDLLIEATHEAAWDPARSVRYTDARKDEQERGISIKATPVSLVLADSRGKSFLLNLLDTPGHVNFSDEVSASLRVADGVILCIDAVEGALLNTERLVRHALAERLPLTLVITKVDRLVLELKLPPADAYQKLSHVVHEVNALIEALAPAAFPHPPLSPLHGTVVFAAAAHGWSFSLESFAKMYVSRFMAGSGSGSVSAAADAAAAPLHTSPALDHRELARRLWGDVYYDPATRRFRNKPSGSAKRSFVHFVLEPIYKVYAQVLGEEVATLAATLARLGVSLRRSELHLDPKPLLKLVFRQFLGSTDGLVDMLVHHVPSPDRGTASKVEQHYAGDLDGPEAAAMRSCDARGVLMVHVVKLFSSPDAAHFFAFGRVMSGTVSAGQQVKVLGEAYSAEDSEDMAVTAVAGVSVGQARYRLEVGSAGPGNWVLLEGIDGVVAKTATVTGAGADAADAAIFRPLLFNTLACVNLSVEPLNPSELPRVLAGLRAVQKSYPLARTRVEESGEHVLIGTGELALDCMLHDLREMYSRVEVKVADPIVSFSETCVEQSSMPCFGDTPNKKNRLTMLAEPLDKGLAEDIEGGAVDLRWDRRRVGDFFQQRYGWDLLAARSAWACGPGERGPNLLLDDTQGAEHVDRRALASVRDSIVQGFHWACREGPLCDEPIRNVKFKLLDVRVAGEALARGGGQVIPTARRVAFSSFLLATPRLMEPVYLVEVLCPADAVQAVYTVLARRRGHVTGDAPRPGTPFYVVRGFLPVVDSFGFETDLRVHTQGLAFGLQAFDHWAIVPGDPLDRSIVLRPLEPSPPLALAREFMVKSRRRKGLSEDVSVTRFFDSEMLLYAARHGAEA